MSTKDEQIVKVEGWVPISKPPANGSIVTAGHTAGWTVPDVLYVDGHFYQRVNHLTGGHAGFKQKDWKKPNGDPASPDEWPWGPELFPTHYMPAPVPPLAHIAPEGSTQVPRYFSEGEVKAIVQEILDSNGPILEAGKAWPSAYLYRTDVEAIAAKHKITL